MTEFVSAVEEMLKVAMLRWFWTSVYSGRKRDGKLRCEVNEWLANEPPARWDASHRIRTDWPRG